MHKENVFLIKKQSLTEYVKNKLHFNAKNQH